MASLDEALYRKAYAQIESDPDAIRMNATVAMGFLAGSGLPGCHAAVVRLFEIAYPTAPLPDVVMTLLSLPREF